MPTDEELIEEIKNGSQAAMEVLVKKYYKNIFAYVYRKTSDYHLAYDLTQEVFIKMMKSIGAYKSKGKFEHWLITIAVNHCRDYFRSSTYKRKKQEQEIVHQMKDDSKNVWDLLSKKIESEKVKEALNTLPDFQNAKKLGDPYAFYLTGGWREMFSFIEPGITVIFLSILVLLGVTPVFADEYKNKTIALILATKYGKSKIVTAKILAIFTYIIVMLTTLHFANAILQIIKYGGLRGWNVPIQNLSTALDSLSMIDLSISPYALEIWHLYVLTFILQLVGCVAIAILVVLISIVCKSTMQTLFISGSAIGIPVMLIQFVPEGGVFSHILSFNYGEFFRVVRLIEEFKTYHVFGFPILYANVFMTIFAVLSTIYTVLIYNRYRRTQISH